MRILAALVALASAAAVACSPVPERDGGDASIDAPIEVTAYELAIMTPRADGGYVPLTPETPFELFQGFQGFIYARVVLVASGDAPESAEGRSVLSIEGVEPATQNYGSIALVPDTDGRRRSEALMIFGNDLILSAIQQHRYTLRFELTNRTSRARAEANGEVFHNPDCVDDGNGACLPREDAASDATDATGSDAPIDVPAVDGYPP